jgi:hypothetical protein
MSPHPKPKLLHTMQIGMLEHHQKWISHCMKTHKLLDNTVIRAYLPRPHTQNNVI